MGTQLSSRLESSVQVLAEDPELAQGLDGDRLHEATRICEARVVRVSLGAWNPEEARLLSDSGIGLLVLDGLLARRVGVAERYGAELLGAGDVLRPWQFDDIGRTLPRTGNWRALAPSRLAVLDREFVEQVAPYPEVISCLFSRALRRAGCAAVRMAIVHQPRVNVRIRMLLWDYADRWGRVRGDGVHLPLHLTHAMIAELVAARRPTVTKALGELAAQEEVAWTGRGWLLKGEPPVELQAVGEVSLQRA